KKSGTFNQGYSLTENLASSNLDFEWHTIGADKTIDDVNAFEKEALSRTKLDVVHAVPPRYRSTDFAHIFSGGYAAGYYSYLGADKTIEYVNAIEKAALSRTQLDVVPAVPPHYSSTYFAHIFSGGYAAGYYSYLWTEMLDHDARNWFETHGVLTRENGQRFREMVLSKGDTEPLDEVYRNWSGRNPEIGPLLKARGVK